MKSNLNPNSRFTSSGGAAKTSGRKVSEQTDEHADDDEYSEDFDSISKSQVGLSVSKVSVKKTLKAGDESNSYSNDFESMGESKSMSTEATVVCFMCKK